MLCLRALDIFEMKSNKKLITVLAILIICTLIMSSCTIVVNEKIQDEIENMIDEKVEFSLEECKKSVICVAATQQYTSANDPTIVLTRSDMGTGFGVGIPGEKVQYIATAAHVVYEPSGVYAVIEGPGYYDIVAMEDGTYYPDRYTTTIDGIDCEVYVDYFKVEPIRMYAVYQTGVHLDLTLTSLDSEIAVCELISDPTDKITALPIKSSENVKAGDRIVAIGYAGSDDEFGKEIVFSCTDAIVREGKISKKQSTKSSNGSVIDTYKVSAELVKGMSGGPVIDEETGAVVGVTFLKHIDKYNDANMAICIDDLKSLLDDIGIDCFEIME